MHDVIRLELEKWGLPAVEAQAYLALVRNGSLTASSIAKAIGIPRTSVYPILESLVQKGLLENGAGLGSRYTAIRPKEALPPLMVREREELVRRDRLTTSLIKQLESVAHPLETNGEVEAIQVLRDRRAVAERFARLQHEAERQVDVMITAPIQITREGNPAQEKAQARGVRFRGLYELLAVEDPGIEPYLGNWIAAGEQARVHNGKLPHKLAIFDSEVVMLPLIMPGDQMRALVIRHPQLAESLSMLFEFLWERAKPIIAGRHRRARTSEDVRMKTGKQAKAPGRQAASDETGKD